MKNDMRNEKAKAEFEKAKKDALKSIEEIKEKIASFSSPVNWGHVGDMNFIKETLNNITR
jgi:sugar-specific transcriptional regulator TrmB